MAATSHNKPLRYWRISVERLRLITAVLLISLAGLVFLTFINGCQNDAKETGDMAIADEPQRDVEGMDEFLDALRTALHAKMDDDFATVRDSMPALKRAFEKLMGAELTSFHDDVKEEFEEKKQALAATMVQFESAAESDDDTKLGEALEDVRSDYVGLMIALSVQLEEIDDFHEVLRPLWHEAVPNQDYDAIKAAIPELKILTNAIMEAQLPMKYKFLEKDFNERRKALKVAIDNLAQACEADTSGLEIEDRMIDMHDAYHDLSECLE